MNAKSTFHRQLSDEIIIKRLLLLLKINREDATKTNLEFSVALAKQSFRISISNFNKEHSIFDYQGAKFSVYEIPFIANTIEVKFKQSQFPNHIPKDTDS